MSVWDWYFDNSTSTESPIEVEYQFDAGEREVTYYNDGSGYPGDASSVSIVKFKFRGVDITPIIWALVESDAIDDLEMEINEFEDNGGSFDITDFME
jgi:hypothetical protein